MAGGSSARAYSSYAQDEYTDDPVLAKVSGGQIEQEDTREQKAERDQLRSRYFNMVNSVAASTTAFTQKDVEETRQGFTDALLEAGGALSHDAKLKAIQENIDKYLPETLKLVQKFEKGFLEKINTAVKSGWISSESGDKWKKRLASEDVAWYKKKTFLENEFKQYAKNWESLAADGKKLKESLEKSGLTARDVPELKPFLDKGFIKQPYATKKAVIDNAIAAVAAAETGKQEFYTKAQSLLDDAVKNGELSPAKVSTWMRRIFSGEFGQGNIEAFLTGTGPNSLHRLRSNWSEVRKRFDTVEKKRVGRKAPGFNFVKSEQFLSWHYASRLAYVQEAERRVTESIEMDERVKDIFSDINREMSAKDWDTAQALIDDASAMDLTAQQRKELGSKQQYLSTQKEESPQESETSTNAARMEMFAALEEAKRLSPMLYDMCVAAVAEGYDTYRAFSSVMYNRCWCRENGVSNDERELDWKQTTRQSTKQVLDKGHGQGFENNEILTGYEDPAIRNHDQNEWSPQVLHVGNNPGAIYALVQNCREQKNNFSFKYWTTVIPEGISYEKHQYFVYSLSWKIKAGIRAGGALSKQDLLLEKAA